MKSLKLALSLIMFFTVTGLVTVLVTTNVFAHDDLHSPQIDQFTQHGCFKVMNKKGKMKEIEKNELKKISIRFDKEDKKTGSKVVSLRLKKGFLNITKAGFNTGLNKIDLQTLDSVYLPANSTGQHLDLAIGKLPLKAPYRRAVNYYEYCGSRMVCHGYGYHRHRSCYSVSRYRRVTGFLTTNYREYALNLFEAGKIDEKKLSVDFNYNFDDQSELRYGVCR